MLLLSKYDVIDLSQIRGLLRKSTDPPGRFCKTGHFAMFDALYLRLTGSVFVPVKNVVFLMLRALAMPSILYHRYLPLDTVYLQFYQIRKDITNHSKVREVLGKSIYSTILAK